MKTCKQCILPDTFPGISFDEEGICNFCTEHANREDKTGSEAAPHFHDENELAAALEKFKDPENNYDVLVSLSGGVDSSYALIKIVEKYKLRPLCFHNDFSYEDETAVNNVKKLCRALDVDLLIWRNDYSFMKKMWKYVNESKVAGMSACYFCGNIVHLNALELADQFKIRLVINGLSKGQAWTINNVDKARQLMYEMSKILAKDEDFFMKYMKKNELLVKQKFYQTKDDLLNPDTEKIMVIPFFIFKFYKTDKETLRNECIRRFDWSELKLTYPARTTNCEMSWLNSYCDLKKMGFSTYHEEYAQLIRAGEISREQALRDLELHPPEGFLEKLAREINLKL